MGVTVVSIRSRALFVVMIAMTTAGLTACSPPPQTPMMPLTSSSSGSGAQATTQVADPTADTAGNIPVTWTAVSGTARQDPLGLLSGTPLLFEGGDLKAAKTVDFVPTAPDATSATGRYVYNLDMSRSGVTQDYYDGTMQIVWTMTIVRPGSRSDFRAEYFATVHATYSSTENKIIAGKATGTADTVDTFTAGSTKAPSAKKSAKFVWTFATP